MPPPPSAAVVICSALPCETVHDYPRRNKSPRCRSYSGNGESINWRTSSQFKLIIHLQQRREQHLHIPVPTPPALVPVIRCVVVDAGTDQRLQDTRGRTGQLNDSRCNGFRTRRAIVDPMGLSGPQTDLQKTSGE